MSCEKSAALGGSASLEAWALHLGQNRHERVLLANTLQGTSLTPQEILKASTAKRQDSESLQFNIQRRNLSGRDEMPELKR
jgi:hypothetical protein